MWSKQMRLYLMTLVQGVQDMPSIIFGYNSDLNPSMLSCMSSHVSVKFPLRENRSMWCRALVIPTDEQVNPIHQKIIKSVVLFIKLNCCIHKQTQFNQKRRVLVPDYQCQ